MAPLTWRNVDSPNFSGANDMWRTAASLMNSGLDRARQGLADFRDITTEEQSAALMQKVVGAGNDPAAVQAAVAGANPAFVSPAALQFANNQPGVFLDRAGKQLSNEGQGITNRYNAQGIDIRAYDFGRKQIEDQRIDANIAARPQAMADAQTLWADMNSQDPAVRNAALARQGDFLKANGEALGITDATGFSTFMGNGMRYQDTQMALDQNRLANAKLLDDAITSNDAKSIRDGALAMFDNNPDRAITAITNDPRIDPTTRVEALKQLTEYKAAIPGKSAADAALESAGITPSTQSVLPGYDPAAVPAAPARRSNVDNVLTGLVDRTEGGGRYDTLYGNAEDKNGPLAGVDVSRMTIGDLKQFSAGDGAYGQSQKEKLGYLATPMGRYQIVGQTMRATAKEMGLSDDVVFSPEVQDAMFNHIANKAISGPKTMEGKMASLRGQWEGFKNVSDGELSAAITAYQNGSPLDLTNLQRSQVTGLYGGDPATAAQREYQAYQAQNPAVNMLGDFSNTPAVAPARIQELSAQLLGSTAPVSVPAPVTPTKSVDAATLLAQQAANGSSVTPTVADDPAARLLAEAANQTNNNNAALDAGLTQSPKKEDLTKEYKIAGNITVPGISDNQTGFQRDFTQNRDAELGRAMEYFAQEAAPAPITQTLGSAWDYFFTDEKGAAANSAANEEANAAREWYRSPETKAYFSANPSELMEAKKDPKAYALANMGKTAGQQQTETGNGTQTTAQQTQATVDMAANRTRMLNNAETVDQMFSAVRNTSALNQTNQRYQSITDAIQKQENASESAAETAARLTSKGGKDGGAGVLSEYKHSEVTAAIQKIRDRLGVSPAIAGALLLETGNYDQGFLGFGEGYDVRDMDKVETLWQNYQKTANASNGIAALTATDLTKYQTTQIANVQQQVTQQQEAWKAAIADPNVDPAKKALYEQALAQLPERTRAMLNNIMASGAVNNNLATKPDR